MEYQDNSKGNFKESLVNKSILKVPQALVDKAFYRYKSVGSPGLT